MAEPTNIYLKKELANLVSSLFEATNQPLTYISDDSLMIKISSCRRASMHCLAVGIEGLFNLIRYFKQDITITFSKRESGKGRYIVNGVILKDQA